MSDRSIAEDRKIRGFSVIDYDKGLRALKREIWGQPSQFKTSCDMRRAFALKSFPSCASVLPQMEMERDLSKNV
jgi:hypothetical protein